MEQEGGEDALWSQIEDRQNERQRQSKQGIFQPINIRRALRKILLSQRTMLQDKGLHIELF